MKHMNVVRRFGARVGAVVVAGAVAAPAFAVDVSGAIDELQSAGTAAATLIGAAVVFAGICMAGFALYRRIK